MHRRSTLAAAAVAVPLVIAAAVPATAVEAEGDAAVSVLHAVPDLPVDVYVDGEEFLPDFQPGTLTDPTPLAAGTYDITIFPAGEDPEGDPAISAEGVEVPAGANATIVAHLSESGEPTATPFVNDISQLEPGQARVTARHTAAAPAVDVRVNETPTFEGLTNPNEAGADVDAGSISADVVLAGESEPVIGPADLDLAEGTHTIVYAWGSAEDENLDLAVQTIDGLHGDPEGVPGGDVGLAASSSTTGWVIAASLVAATLGAAGFAATRSGLRGRS